MHELTDAELMERTKTGDPSAFTQLVDRYKHSLVNMLTRMVGSRDRAEDLAQETFLRLYQHADRYNEQGKLLSFLFQIAGNLVRSEERRGRRWRRIVPIFGPSLSAPLAPHQERGVLETEAQSLLTAAIAELPLTYREPLVLHEIEGLPYEQVATICGLPEGTVKSRINRGRQKLRERLAPYWNGVASCTTTAS